MNHGRYETSIRKIAAAAGVTEPTIWRNMKFIMKMLREDGTIQ